MAQKSRAYWQPRIKKPGFLWKHLFKPQEVALNGIRLIAQDKAIAKKFWRGLYRGGYEAAEFQVLKDTLRPDDRVLELGGGIGYLSAHSAKICGSENVVVVEADPGSYDLMCRNHALNGLSPTAHHAVVGRDAKDSVRFYQADSMLASSAQRKADKWVDIPQLSFADLVRDHQPTYLVSDVEGAEGEIFDGADLSSIKRILIEVHEDVIGADGITKLFRRFLDEGFQLSVAQSRDMSYYFFRD